MWKANEGDRPLPDDTIVTVELRDGGRDRDKVSNYRWGIENRANDIIRYQVSESDSKATILREIADEIERVGEGRVHESFQVWCPGKREWIDIRKGCIWGNLEMFEIRRKPKVRVEGEINREMVEYAREIAEKGPSFSKEEALARALLNLVDS